MLGKNVKKLTAAAVAMTTAVASDLTTIAVFADNAGGGLPNCRYRNNCNC